jgi:hypothetical protein
MAGIAGASKHSTYFFATKCADRVWCGLAMALRRLVILVALAGVGADTVRADHEPVIAVPGRRDVPVLINGQNATGAVVIGDWGLYRPGHMGVTIIRRRPWYAPGYYRPAVRRYRRVARPCRCKPAKTVRKAAVAPGRRHYFPGGMTPPRLGRVEVDRPPRPQPQAESFSRSWSAGSQMAPANLDPPAIVNAPTVIENRFRPRPRPPRRVDPPRRPPR